MNKFKAILDPIADLLERKNRDYGNSYDGLREEYGEVAFLVRLSDKINRLKTLHKAERQVKDESVEDTIRDIIGYCALELNYRKEVGKGGIHIHGLDYPRQGCTCGQNDSAR